MNFKITTKKFNGTIVFLIVIVIFFMSCDKSTNKRKEVKSERDSLVGEKLILPQRMLMYQPFSDSNSIDSARIANSSLKVYSLIDGSCVECVGSIKSWINFTKTINVPVILIIRSADDQFNLFKYVCEEGEFKDFKYPFFLDVKNEFYSLNRGLFANKGITVLTDGNNKILLIDNPTQSFTIQRDYLDKIKSLKSN
jgi:hypothetical protein